jgi:uncharacterized lipoprotein YddW (UPF0748 family)
VKPATRRIYGVRALAALVVTATCLSALGEERATPEVRALWVTRYDYRTEDDVRQIVRNAADLGINRLIFQVRGQADALYASELEPWSERLGGEHPGFDPLAVAVESAGAAGLELEAWINAMPLWKGTTPPADPKHPFHSHPEWRVVGSDGAPQALNTHYVCANPARADVRAHVARVAADIAKRYAVDAIHLDYIRYVTDLEERLDFSHDAVSLAAFGKDPSAHPAAWAAFKTRQVTAVVREVRAAVRAARPECRLTAAVYPGDAPRARVFQDPAAWAREGLVDALYPMNYRPAMDIFRARLAEDMALGGSAGKGATAIPIYPGVGIFRHTDPERTREQLAAVRAADAGGFALFCYAALFESADRRELHEPDARLRRARREALRALFAPPSGEGR